MKHFSVFMICFLSLIIKAQDKAYIEWYLQREDTDIFVKEIGTGADTVIVVHGGFGANHDYMLDALEGLKNEFRFVLYDQRGSLLSPAAKENLTFQKNVEDLYALVKALKLENVKLFCHSMGTLVGMEFARQYPVSVSHLILTGSIFPKSDSIENIFSKRMEDQVAFLANRVEVKKMLEPYKLKGLENLRTIQDIETSSLTHKDLTEYWRISFASVNIYDISKFNLVKGGRAYYKQEASVMSETVNWKYDYRDILNKIKTTFINGDHDFFDFHAEILKQQLEDYSSIELKLAPQAGHNIWIDQPMLFENYLRGALKR
ncbi:alpha/beta fold hydrolase [Moheibacter sediminis]|uniref:Pimeloyl-ACP methyl ester carboxylesterase n=1 Tax=Moheibacter sediminis TaxID=1434700 RepID=A0A1W1ZC41_9FLAO|nr:alpha/beta hydrolase [Moheibacter sediminis]SMC45994.1 Pimeloyl-ACP methyl ester carboxylesterase [Moheibacter sediminis]